MKKIQLFKNDLPNDFKLSGKLAIDTETLGLKPHRDPLCLVQIADEKGQIVLIQFKNKYNAPNLCQYLCNKRKIKIFHFARFDVAILQHYFKIEIENIFCTKIASKLARTYTDRHGLKDLVYEYLDIELNKAKQSSNWQDKLSDEQIDYAANDVRYLHQLYDKFIPLLKDRNLYEITKKTCAYIPTRAKLDILGWDNIDIFSHR